MLVLRAYALAHRSGLLNTRIGDAMFSRAYFAYKRFEDPHAALIRAHPELFRGGNVIDVTIPPLEPLRAEPEPIPLTILHEGQFPAITLSFNLRPGSSLGAAVKAIQNAEKEIGLPDQLCNGDFWRPLDLPDRERPDV